LCYLSARGVNDLSIRANLGGRRGCAGGDDRMWAPRHHALGRHSGQVPPGGRRVATAGADLPSLGDCPMHQAHRCRAGRPIATSRVPILSLLGHASALTGARPGSASRSEVLMGSPSRGQIPRRNPISVRSQSLQGRCVADPLSKSKALEARHLADCPISPAICTTAPEQGLRTAEGHPPRTVALSRWPSDFDAWKGRHCVRISGDLRRRQVIARRIGSRFHAVPWIGAGETMSWSDSG